MKIMHAMRARLRLLFRGEAEGRMEEEVRFHLEMEAEKYVRAGMSPAEAKRRAVLAFGGVEGHKEAMRDGRTFGWASGVSLDFKLGFRMLRKYPGLTVVGGLAMAFAIWVGASAFEFLTQVVKPVIPLEEGHRIVGLRNWDASASRTADPSPHDFLTWRDGLKTVDDVGAFRTVERSLTAPGVMGGPVEVAEMSAAGFRVARARPLLGRALSAEDERPGAPAVAVIGHEAWRTRFGGDPAVLGRSVRLGSGEATVIGVMPEGFAFPVSHGFWVPLRLDAGEGGDLGVFGRLANGVSLREAQSELSIVGRRAAGDSPETHRHLRPRVMPYAQSIMGLSRMESAGVMSMNLFVVMLLFLVCGNVALLMFARAATRESEIVLRNALGASRGRIIAQLFTEALVLAGVAAAAGLLAARFGLGLVHGLVENGLLEGRRLPFWFHASLSPRTVLYTLGLTALCALIAGVLPAMKVTRGLGTSLRRATAGAGGFRFGGVWTAVIVAQIAITVLFPVMALATQRDMAGLRSTDVGFAEAEFLSMRLEIDAAPSADTSRAALLARYGAAYRALERRLEADPSVAGVTFGDRLPRMYHPHRVVQLDEGGAAAPDPRWPGHRVRTASVDTEFFQTLRAPVLLGRGLHAGDAAPGARVVIVNQAFVDGVLGGRNPVGRRMRYSDGADPRAEPWHEIVGVVGDLGMHVGGPAAAGFYHPVAPGAAYPAHLAIHVKGDPESFAPGLHALAASVDPALRLHDVVPMDALSDPEVHFLGTWFWLIIGFSSLAVLLALAGIYAVMAFTVAQRTREIGIRVALGADARRIVAAIFRRPLTQVAIGISAGGVVTAVLPALVGGAMSVMLVAVVAAHMVLTMGICLLACAVPTRRALAVDPGEALRVY